MQPINERLIKKINELVKDGVKNVNEIKRHLTFYIKNDIFSGTEVPPKTNRRFYPRKKNHSCHVLKKNIWKRVFPKRLIVFNTFSKLCSP